MEFDPPLEPAVLLRRYKRFLADVRLADGSTTTAHCANPGSMLGVSEPGSPVLVRRARGGGKLDWSLEAIKVEGAWVGIHPVRANALVEEGLLAGKFPELYSGPDHGAIRREASPERMDNAPGARTRFDFRIDRPGRPPLWIEVKYVTLAVNGLALFPDSVSIRAARHAAELADRVDLGEEAALVFVSPRPDVSVVGPADGIDPDYGHALRDAAARGVRVLAVGARIDARGLVLADRLGVSLGPHRIEPGKTLAAL